MKYKAFFSFDFMRDDGTLIENENLPVAKMMVDGGTSRIIDWQTTDDLSLISELEQTRSNENIILYLSATGDHRSMKAALDLTEIARLAQKGVALTLTVERFDGKQMLEGIELSEMFGSLRFPPRNAFDKMLMARFDVPNVELKQGKIRHHQLSKAAKKL